MSKLIVIIGGLIFAALVIFIIVRGRKNVKKVHERFEQDVEAQNKKC